MTKEEFRTFSRTTAKPLRKITTPKGILLRMNRSIPIVGAFGVIKDDSGFRRFLIRGKKGVRTDFLLMSMGYNITNSMKNRENPMLPTASREGNRLIPG